MKCVGCQSQDIFYNCVLCKSPICVDCESKLRGSSVCPVCLGRLRDRKLAAYKAECERLNCPCGFLLGLVMAVATAIAWSQIALFTRGPFVAGSLLMGAMVGYGVMRGAGGKRGYVLQQIACLIALIGSVFAYYLVFVRTEARAYAGLAGGASSLLGALYAFPGYLSQLNSLAWVFLVGGAALAYYIPHVRTLPGE